MNIQLRRSLSSTRQELATAIREVQARSRTRLCQDPDALAQRVLGQVRRLLHLAAAFDVGVSDLAPSATWWEAHVYSATEEQTLVMLRYGELIVQRGNPGNGTWNGRVHMHIDETMS